MGSIAAGLVLGLVLGDFVTLAFFLGFLYFPVYVWGVIQAFLNQRDWLGFGMIVAVLLAWPAYTLSCFAALGAGFSS